MRSMNLEKSIMSEACIMAWFASKCVSSARVRTFMFLKKQRIAWPSKQPSASKGLGYLEKII